MNYISAKNGDNEPLSLLAEHTMKKLILTVVSQLNREFFFTTMIKYKKDLTSQIMACIIPSYSKFRLTTAIKKSYFCRLY